MRMSVFFVQCLAGAVLLSGCVIVPARAGTNTRATNTAEAPASGKRADVLATAKQYLGTPYRYGGMSPAGFDCSGYVLYVFNKAGVKLPHNAADQFRKYRRVERPRPGDLVFFHTYGNDVSHVGIYAGNNLFLHSPRSGKTVEYTDMRIDYWKTRYRGACAVFL